jgi:hypothetical protein
MILLEDIKKLGEKTTGWRTPSPQALDDLVQHRKAKLLRFKDDGAIPNHPRWPLLIYKAAVQLPDSLDPAAIFEEQDAAWVRSARECPAPLEQNAQMNPPARPRQCQSELRQERASAQEQEKAPERSNA